MAARIERIQQHLKLMKIFLDKTIQVLIQSRMGEKIKTKSTPHSSPANWFNLSIANVPEIETEAKKKTTHCIPVSGFRICCEISLYTTDGDFMVLEIWAIDIQRESAFNEKESDLTYSHLSMLLKSVIVISRITPAYKLSFQQGADSFVICYRIYKGKPEYHTLGEEFEEIKVGEIGTMFGILKVDITYRTNMVILPQLLKKNNLLVVKEDYFQINTNISTSKHSLKSKEMIRKVDNLRNSKEKSFVKKFQQKSKEKVIVSTTVKITQQESPQTSERDENNDKWACKSLEYQWKTRNIGAFANPENKTNENLKECILMLPDATPLLDLLNYCNQSEEEYCDMPPVQEDEEGNKKYFDINQNSSSDSISDEFSVTRLKPLFAECDTSNEVFAFHDQVDSAPLLWQISSTLEEQIFDINGQLPKLEECLTELDVFVDSMCAKDNLE